MEEAQQVLNLEHYRDIPNRKRALSQIRCRCQKWRENGLWTTEFSGFLES
jgi:hypothetical protein